MSQLRDKIWAYFKEHHRIPDRTPTIDAMLDTLASQEERAAIEMDLCAMQIVSYLHNEGKDLTPEQQVWQIELLIQETISMLSLIRNEKGWRPIR